jgi:DNA repair protein RadA/Sms
MAKNSTKYVCSNCGAQSPQMIGRCPVCGEWGTYEEEQSVAVSTKKGGVGLRRGAQAQRLHEVEAREVMRLDMQSSELNRVLGGGLVP